MVVGARVQSIKDLGGFPPLPPSIFFISSMDFVPKDPNIKITALATEKPTVSVTSSESSDFDQQPSELRCGKRRTRKMRSASFDSLKGESDAASV